MKTLKNILLQWKALANNLINTVSKKLDFKNLLYKNGIKIY